MAGEISRLDLLKVERHAIKNMQTMSYNLIDEVTAWYDKEINAIEKYHASNPTYKVEQIVTPIEAMAGVVETVIENSKEDK